MRRFLRIFGVLRARDFCYLQVRKSNKGTGCGRLYVIDMFLLLRTWATNVV